MRTLRRRSWSSSSIWSSSSVKRGVQLLREGEGSFGHDGRPPLIRTNVNADDATHAAHDPPRAVCRQTSVSYSRRLTVGQLDARDPCKDHHRPRCRGGRDTGRTWPVPVSIWRAFRPRQERQQDRPAPVALYISASMGARAPAGSTGACGIVRFKVFETKCPSARQKRAQTRSRWTRYRQAGGLHRRAGRSNEDSSWLGGWYDGRRIGERDHRGVFIGVTVTRPAPDTTVRVLGHLLFKVSNYLRL